MATSNTRIPLQSIVIHRNGATVRPDIGVPFDFTAEEIKDIDKVNPGAYRKAVNEDPKQVLTDIEAEQKAEVQAEFEKASAAVGAAAAKKAFKEATGESKLDEVEPAKYPAALEALQALRADPAK